jgi:hypothetical protein
MWGRIRVDAGNICTRVIDSNRVHWPPMQLPALAFLKIQ